MNDFLTIERSALASLPTERVSVAQAIAAHLAEPNANTRATYNGAMRCFAKFLGMEDPTQAGIALLMLEHGQANLLALNYRTWMSGMGWSANTINLRLAAIGAATDLARKLGVILWYLEVDKVDPEPAHISGPSAQEVGRMIQMTPDDSPEGIRDRAIIALMHDMGLRRASVALLEFDDVDLRLRRLQTKVKGHHEKVAFTIPQSTTRELSAWVALRGTAPGPMFLRLDYGRNDKMLPMSGEGLRQVIIRAGERIGIKTHPHALRHTGATTTALATGSVFSVQKFLKHRNIETAQRYVDKLDDLGAKAAEIVSKSRE